MIAQNSSNDMSNIEWEEYVLPYTRKIFLLKWSKVLPSRSSSHLSDNHLNESTRLFFVLELI